MRRTTVISTIALAMASITAGPAVAGAADNAQDTIPADSGALGAESTAATAEPTTEAAAAGRSLVIFNGTSTATTSTFWNAGHQGPGNLVSPVNYTAGNATLKINVLSKPSSKALKVQVCAWRNNYVQETCSGTGIITHTGAYSFNLGRPAGWWKKNGSWSWSTPFNPMYIMVKDAATNKLMMTRNCGRSCSSAGAVAGHMPVRMSGTLTFTAP